MISVIFFIGFLSLFTFFLEFFLPGGIMAILGIILGVAFLGFVFTLGLILGVASLFSYLGLLVIIILIALKFVRSSQLTLKEDQSGYSSSEFDQSIIGKVGHVHKDLRPSGVVVIEEKMYQAISEGDYIHKGKKIFVKAKRGSTAIVASL